MFSVNVPLSSKPGISISLNGYDGTGQAEKRDDAAEINT